MKRSQILSFCRKNRINLLTGWQSHCNCIRFHDKRESWKHFLFKARIGFELMKHKQTIFTEFEFETKSDKERMKRPVCDLFWLDELMVIELESKYSDDKALLKYKQFRPFNVFVFDMLCRPS